MFLKPLLTEKTQNLAKEGKYTFRVGKGLTKHEARKLIEEIYGVHVREIWSLKESGEVKKTLAGRKRIVKPGKKVIVQLKEKEKIDLFESKK